MRKAQAQDKEQVVRTLALCFDSNKSVNYIIPQDHRRQERITRLMEYSFDYCQLFGDVYLSPGSHACALIVYPHKVKTSLQSILLDLRLIIKCIGLSNVRKVLRREAIIKKLHPKGPFCYLWFIGTAPDVQRKGIGTALLKAFLDLCDQQNLPVYLETSVERNLPWYKKWGFAVYEERDLGYRLYCMRRD